MTVILRHIISQIIWYDECCVHTHNGCTVQLPSLVWCLCHCLWVHAVWARLCEWSGVGCVRGLCLVDRVCSSITVCLWQVAGRTWRPHHLPPVPRSQRQWRRVKLRKKSKSRSFVKICGGSSFFSESDLLSIKKINAIFCSVFFTFNIFNKCY